MAEDYYSLLGVATDASEEAILEAYRRKAAEHHPDVSDEPDAEATFRRLNRAKAVLTDDERRRAYDRLGHERFQEREGQGAAGPGDRTRDGDASRSRPPSDRRGDPAGRWPAGIGSFLDHLFGGAFDRQPGRASAGHGGLRAGRAGTRDPFEVDLSAWLRGGGGAAAGGSPGRPGGSGRECPKCGGRGTFVHVLDTGRGRRRRLEACERCGGDGTVPA